LKERLHARDLAGRAGRAGTSGLGLTEGLQDGGRKEETALAVSVNVVVLAGTIAADPVERRMPSGEECTEIRLSVPEPGRRLLPLPVVAWHAEVGKKRLKGLRKDDEVLVYGRLVRRFYRSGAGARSLTEVVASGLKRLEPSEVTDRDEQRDDSDLG